MGLYQTNGIVYSERCLSARRAPYARMLTMAMAMAMGLMLALWLWHAALLAHPAEFPAIAPVAPHLLSPCTATPLPC
jgi:hypothetical protein